MAAVTVSNVRKLGQMNHVRGRAYLATITHTSSYATGGEDLPLSSFAGIKRVELVAPVSGSAVNLSKWRGKTIKTQVNGAAVIWAGSASAPKLKLQVGAGTPAEVGAATNVSAITYDLLIIGR